MIEPGDVISYLGMCGEEGVNLQRGMNLVMHCECAGAVIRQRRLRFSQAYD